MAQKKKISQVTALKEENSKLKISNEELRKKADAFDTLVEAVGRQLSDSDEIRSIINEELNEALDDLHISR